MNIDEIFNKRKLRIGRTISGGKIAPQGCVCIWNANIIIKSMGKIWYGDLNLTSDGNLLKEIAEELGEPLYVLREMDARFENENDSVDLLISKAKWSTDKELI